MEAMQQQNVPFHLVILQPVKNHPGKVLGSMTVWSDTLKNAIKHVKAAGASESLIVERQSYYRTLKEHNEKHAKKAA